MGRIRRASRTHGTHITTIARRRTTLIVILSVVHCDPILPSTNSTNMCHHVPSCTIMHHHVPSCTIMHHHAPSCTTIMHHHAPSCTTIMHHHHAPPSCTSPSLTCNTRRCTMTSNAPSAMEPAPEARSTNNVNCAVVASVRATAALMG